MDVSVQVDGLNNNLLTLDMSIRKFVLLVLSMLLSLNRGYARDLVYSPNRKFYCELIPKKDFGMIVNVADSVTEISIELIESDRWVEILWSPEDAEFALVDHWDGHSSSLRIFKIKSREAKIQIIEIYHSPEMTIGVEWEMKSWSIEKGNVWIRRKQVMKQLDKEIKHLELEEFRIPIE